jgi:ABC-type multidrug transport system ATPase subunit/pSer/pThr/pTyr-binding forkhead associated (FHA) protein
VRRPRPLCEATLVETSPGGENAALSPADHQPYLEVRTDQGRTEIALKDTVIDIGRDPENDILLDDLVVSAHHLRLMRDGNSFVLMHPHPDRIRTLNGLYYQGQHIRGDQRFRTPLADGDIIRIGDEGHSLVTLVFHDGSPATPAVPPVQPIALGEPVLTIGRRADCKVTLAHPQVSALHALLVREGGTYRMIDQHSTNGVYVNGERREECLLALGDEIRIGPYRLVYEASQLSQFDESRFISIQAKNLWTAGSNGSVLLDDISLNIPPRAFVALVGGSGAGKSTLMDALSGVRPAQRGSVHYNGHDYYANIAAYRTNLGYVPQDDIVHKDLTVERALYYAAKLRLPGDFTDEQIAQRISEVLEDVEMTPRRSLLVRKLSGGQRKRVSIALELLANPSIFFLDEPTSGLDPGLDRKMMNLLRKLADRGHTVVLVTHATTNLNVCDYICFLAQGGRLAYYGPPDEAKAYFGKTDLAEIYASLEPTDMNPRAPEEAEVEFKRSTEYQDYILGPLAAVKCVDAAASRPIETRTRTSRRKAGAQFRLLAQRNLELLRNNRTNLIILLVQAPVIALILMLLIRSELGAGLFNQDKVLQCSPQITQTLVTTTPTSENPSGAVRIGLPATAQAGSNQVVDCHQIAQLLSGDPASKADATTLRNAQNYASRKGGVNAALQDFIVPGSGLNALRVIFIVAYIAVMFGCVNGVRALVKEASIYRRERAVSLGILPYVFSKVSVLGTCALVQCAAVLLILQLFEPLRGGVMLPVLVEVYISIALTALAGLMVGLTASAFAKNEDVANSLIPLLLIPQVVFAGAEIALKDAPLQLIAAMLPTRWGLTALGTIIGIHTDKLGGDSLLGTDTTFHGTLLSTFSQADAVHRVLLAWGALATLVTLLILLVCLGLKRRDVRVSERGRAKAALSK